MPTNPQGLQPLDWGIIGAYAVGTIAVGWYYGRKQESSREYFVGSGNMNPILIGVSLFATLLSTITYLSAPGEVVGKGPVHLATLLALPFVYVIVAFVLLPVYMRRRVTSAYELLEERLGVGLRTLGATCFLILRLIWMSLLIYLASAAMVVMLGLDESSIPIVATVTGIVAVVYTSIGGLRAVVVTDLMQTILLMGGALLVIIAVTLDYGGFAWVPREWNPNWDKQPLYSFDPKTRVSVLGTFLTTLTWYVCTAGGDQTSVQRFMATSDAKAAQRAIATQLCVASAVMLLLCFVGFALLGYYELHPDLLPKGFSLKDDADKVFPHFISYQLPVGISGLVVSAMFAAAMSSIDSGVNSITAVISTDFLKRFGSEFKTNRGELLFNKGLAFGIGVIVVIGSTFMGEIPGNIMAVTNKTVNLLAPPIFGLFFFALYVPFARPAAVWISTLLSIVVAAVIAFSGPLVTWLELRWGIPASTFGVEIQLNNGDRMAPDPISFQWMGFTSLLVDVVVGTVLSWILSRTAGGTRQGDIS